MRMTSRRVAVAATLGLLWLAPATLAQTRLPGSDVTGLPSARVSYADLDVGTEAGLRILATRIRNAVRSVCWQSHDPRELEHVYQCRSHSGRDAWRQFEWHQQQARTSRSTVIAAIAIRPVTR